MTEQDILLELIKTTPLALPFVILVYQVREMTKAMSELGVRIADIQANRDDLLKVVKDNTIAMTTVSEVLRQVNERRRATDRESYVG